MLTRGRAGAECCVRGEQGERLRVEGEAQRDGSVRRRGAESREVLQVLQADVHLGV